MISMVSCLRRRPDVSREEFQRWWSEDRGPLMEQHAAALRVVRYVQHHSIDASPREDESLAVGREAEPFDGIATLTWASMDEFVTARTSPEGRRAFAAVTEGGDRYIDRARSPIWLTQDQVIIAGPLTS